MQDGKSAHSVRIGKTSVLTPKEKYDIAYNHQEYAGLEASIGLKLVPWVMENVKFKSVLDVGCGSGHALIKFLEAGKQAKGTEISDTLLRGRLATLTELGIVRRAYAHELPFGEGEFDLVFSTEVLEHIGEGDVHRSLAELLRVARRYVFATICYREANCFPELHLHETVKPKEWWMNEIGRFRVRVSEVGERSDGGCYVITKL